MSAEVMTAALEAPRTDGVQVGPHTMLLTGKFSGVRKVGGSMVGPLMGRSQFREHAGDMFDRILDLVERRPFTPAMEAGVLLEAMMVKWCGKEVGKQFLPLGNCVFARTDKPWHTAQIDGVEPWDGESLVDPKVTNSDGGWGKPGTDEVPRQYWAQFQWQMHVTARKRVYCARLLRGTMKKSVFPVDRDQAFINLAVDVVDDFWCNHVLPARREIDAAKAEGLEPHLTDVNKHRPAPYQWGLPPPPERKGRTKWKEVANEYAEAIRKMADDGIESAKVTGNQELLTAAEAMRLAVYERVDTIKEKYTNGGSDV